MRFLIMLEFLCFLLLKQLNWRTFGDLTRMSKLNKSVTASALLGFVAAMPFHAQAGQNPVDLNVDACEILNVNFKYNQYIDCLRPLADAGSSRAAARLASVFVLGTAVTPDYDIAAKYAAIGAAGDDILSLQLLALFKSVGLGTTKNWEEALQLRRRQALLRSATLPPLRVAGEFTGNRVTETERIPVTVVVGSNGVIQSCLAEGQSENLKELACKGITKSFTFLPAVDTNGKEIEQTWTNSISFRAAPKREKISNVIPARVLSGDILASDFARYKISRTGRHDLQLELDLTSTGLMTGCIVKSSNKLLGQYACKIVKEKFKFSPATLPSGVKKYSKFNLELNVEFPATSDLPNITQDQPQSVSPPPPKSNAAPVQKTTAPTSATGDVILDTAINRCERIGFKRDTSEFRGCVTEQINLLSK
jgi:hypothetical protein